MVGILNFACIPCAAARIPTPPPDDAALVVVAGGGGRGGCTTEGRLVLPVLGELNELIQLYIVIIINYKINLA